MATSHLKANTRESGVGGEESLLYPGSQQPGKTVDKSLKTVSEVLGQIEEFLRGERRSPRNREKSVFFSQR